MEFLKSIKLYANKPANILTNSAVKPPENINWTERLQTVRRLIIDQLGRLKIEEVTLRNLAIKPEPAVKRPYSSTITLPSTVDESEILPDDQSKRFCTSPSTMFDFETINQTDLDLE